MHIKYIYVFKYIHVYCYTLKIISFLFSLRNKIIIKNLAIGNSRNHSISHEKNNISRPLMNENKCPLLKHLYFGS